jgi:SIT family siderophore-iron:H+ symporter-like MFS transporter
MTCTDGIDQYTAGVFLNYATSTAFKQHSLQSTISTVTAVFQAMAQPPIAKCADGFGRYRTYFGLVAFYVLGYIIVASSNGIVTYAVGNSIYIIGITGLFFLQNIIVADLSSTRYRCKSFTRQRAQLMLRVVDPISKHAAMHQWICRGKDRLVAAARRLQAQQLAMGFR